MAKKSKKKRRAKASPAVAEDRNAEIVTVAWMLSMMATLGAELVGGLVKLTVAQSDAAATSLKLFPNLMLFAAGVTGLVCLLLTPIVYRLRRVAPPTSITVLAVTVAAVPLVVGIVQVFR